MKKAFTLIELLVVIAILGILIGILTVSVSSGGESARAAQCLANMKNLANACQTYGMRTGRYPNAGSVELMDMDTSQGRRRVKTSYTERPGWVSWSSQGKYPSNAHSSNAPVGMYCDEEEEAIYAVTNGCLWNYVSHNSQTYVCPSHVRKMKKLKVPPRWSYLMNAYFGWDTTGGSGSFAKDGGGHTDYGRLPRADRFLLFAEVPFMGYSSWQPEGACSEETDGVLYYSGDGLSDKQKGSNAKSGSHETIGANHMIGRTLYAHVAFADGHCEKLQIPYTGSAKHPKADDSQLKNLTSWLCTGLDVSFDGKQYKKMDN